MGSVGTKSGEQNDGVIERGERSGFKSSVRHSGHYDWEGIGDSVDWNEDIEEVEDEKRRKLLIIRFMH